MKLSMMIGDVEVACESVGDEKQAMFEALYVLTYGFETSSMLPAFSILRACARMTENPLQMFVRGEGCCGVTAPEEEPYTLRCAS